MTDAQAQGGGTTPVPVLDRGRLAAIQTAVEGGAVLVRAFGRRSELLELATSMGSLMPPGVGMAPGLHDGVVYTVEVRNNGRGVRDVHGNVIISTTNRAFSLHTDGYNLQLPPRYVLLLRCEDEGQSSPTFVSSVELAISTVPSLSDRLANVLMPSALGPVHFREIVAKDAGPPRYRLNIEEIERWGAITEPGLTSAHRRTLTDLSSALHAVSTTVVLEPTDLLILDNWRVCHGRPELPKRSGRRLERVWVADARA